MQPIGRSVCFRSATRSQATSHTALPGPHTKREHQPQSTRRSRRGDGFILPSLRSLRPLRPLRLDSAFGPGGWFAAQREGDLATSFAGGCLQPIGRSVCLRSATRRKRPPTKGVRCLVPIRRENINREAREDREGGMVSLCLLCALCGLCGLCD